jgi:hypothetical protein
MAWTSDAGFSSRASARHPHFLSPSLGEQPPILLKIRYLRYLAENRQTSPPLQNPVTLPCMAMPATIANPQLERYMDHPMTGPDHQRSCRQTGVVSWESGNTRGLQQAARDNVTVGVNPDLGSGVRQVGHDLRKPGGTNNPSFLSSLSSHPP